MRTRRVACLAVVMSGAAWIAACGSSGGDDTAPLDTSDAGTTQAPAPTPPAPTATAVPDAAAPTPDASDDAGDAAPPAPGKTLDGGACDGGSASVSSVTPLFAYTGAATPVTIQGSGFAPSPRVYLLSASGQTTTLVNATYVSPTSLTATIPSGVAPGTYQLAVVGADECAAFLPSFQIVGNPVPLVLSVSPAQGTTQLDVPVTVTGCHFPANASLSTVSDTGVVLAQTVASVVAGADDARCSGPLYTMTGTILTKTKTMVEGQYLVRVGNPTDATYGDYASFVVSNPSGNLVAPWKAAPSLTVPRRALGVTTARLDDANRFLYAVGGESAAGAPLGSVEVAQVDRFGKLGAWGVQKNALKTARAGLSLVHRGLYLYAVGGTGSTNGTAGAGNTSPSGTPLGSIERAKLLLPSGAPSAPTATPDTTAGTLAKGTYYYRVAAVLDASDPATQGETLASELAGATLTASGKVALSWTAPAVGSVAHYRVYRTPTGASGAGSEVLLADNVATASFTDDGSAAVTTEKPVALGSTGPWLEVGAGLSRARLDASATIAADPTGALFLYVLGGWGKCTDAGATAAMACWELASLSDDGSTLGAFADGANPLAHARLRAGADAMSALNGPSSFATNAGATTAFVVVAGGKGNATSATVEYARVLAGGALSTWASPGGFSGERDGTQLLVANGYGYALFGGQAANAYAGTANQSTLATVTTTSLTFSSWSNAAANLGSKLARHGAAADGAWFYVVGGTTNDSDALGAVWQILH